MKKTRLLSLALAMLMLIGALAACGDGSSQTDGTASSDTASDEATSSITTETNDDIQTETETHTEQESQTSGGDVEVVEPKGDAYYIIGAAAQNGRNGLANGWNYDNRFDLTNTTGKDSNERHDDAVNQFANDVLEGSTDNNADSKVKHIALKCKLFKFFPHK